MVDVAVTLYVVKPPADVFELVTPPENVTVSDVGTFINTTPEPPLPEVPPLLLVAPPPPPVLAPPFPPLSALELTVP